MPIGRSGSDGQLQLRPALLDRDRKAVSGLATNEGGAARLDLDLEAAWLDLHEEDLIARLYLKRLPHLGWNRDPSTGLDGRGVLHEGLLYCSWRRGPHGPEHPQMEAKSPDSRA